MDPKTHKNFLKDKWLNEQYDMLYLEYMRNVIDRLIEMQDNVITGANKMPKDV